MKKCKATVKFSIDYAHRLMHHGGKCYNLHGHTGQIEVSVIGEVDPRTGMVVDFSDLKNVCKVVHNSLDHSTILNKNDTAFVNFFEQQGKYRYFLLNEEPTAENIAYYVKEAIETTWEYVRQRNIEIAEQDEEIGEDEIAQMKSSKNDLKFVIRFYETPNNFVETI